MFTWKYIFKPDHAVTSIKQSPVLNGYIFLVLSYNISHELIILKEVKCLIRLRFLCHLITGLTVYVYVSVILMHVVKYRDIIFRML